MPASRSFGEEKFGNLPQYVSFQIFGLDPVGIETGIALCHLTPHRLLHSEMLASESLLPKASNRSAESALFPLLLVPRVCKGSS